MAKIRRLRLKDGIITFKVNEQAHIMAYDRYYGVDYYTVLYNGKFIQVQDDALGFYFNLNDIDITVPEFKALLRQVQRKERPIIPLRTWVKLHGWGWGLRLWLWGIKIKLTGEL